MVAMILLLQLCVSKIVVVDDLGVTDKQYQSQTVARKVMNALEDTMKNANDTVLLSNSKGTRRIVGMNPSDQSHKVQEDGNNGQMLRRGLDGSNRGEGVGGISGGTRPEYIKKPLEEFMKGMSPPLAGHSSFDPSYLGHRDPFAGRMMGSSREDLYGPQTGAGGYVPGMSGLGMDRDRYGSFPLDGRRSIIEMNDGDIIGRANENMSDASRAKRSLISLKIAQSRQRENTLQNGIDRVLQEIDQVTEKTQDTQKLRDTMMSKLHTRRNHLRNLQGNKKEVENQRGRTLALVRLSRNELLKLSKMMDDQRSKLALLEDEEKIFSDRIKKYDEEYEAGNRELQLDDARMEEIKRNIEELERIYNILKSRSNELMNERNKEGAVRNRLELEVERLDRNVVDFI